MDRLFPAVFCQPRDTLNAPAIWAMRSGRVVAYLRDASVRPDRIRTGTP